MRDIALEPFHSIEEFCKKILFPFSGGRDIHPSLCYCSSCKKFIGFIIDEIGSIAGSSTIEDRAYVFLRPCSRIVLGIHPEIHNAAKIGNVELPFSWSKFIFLCDSCGGKNLVEKVAGVIAEVNPGEENIMADMPKYDRVKGCWITITEFTLDYPRQGKFLNYQTNIKIFNKIISEAFEGLL